MNTKFFKDIPISQEFIFGELTYVKIEKDKGISLAGTRIFNPLDIVVLKEREKER